MESTNPNQNPSVTSRNLLAAIARQVKQDQRPFGGIAILSPDQPIMVAEIAEGNTQTHFQARIARFGCEVVLDQSTGTALDTLVIEVAKQLTIEATRIKTDLPAGTAFRIALEYAAQAVFINPTQVEAFSTYLPKAIALRSAYKGYNAVAQGCTDQAFQGIYAEVSGMFTLATTARKRIDQLCTDNPHLGALRGAMQARIIPDQQAWETLKAQSPQERQGTVVHLLTQVALTGHEGVTKENVRRAHGQVKGNSLLSVGNFSGVSVETAVDVIASSPFARHQQPNGGGIFTARGIGLGELGHNIAGLNGVADKVTVTRKGRDELELTVRIKEGFGNQDNPDGVLSGMPVASIVPTWARSRPSFLAASAG